MVIKDLPLIEWDETPEMLKSTRKQAGVHTWQLLPQFHQDVNVCSLVACTVLQWRRLQLRGCGNHAGPLGLPISITQPASDCTAWRPLQKASV